MTKEQENCDHPSFETKQYWSENGIGMPTSYTVSVCVECELPKHMTDREDEDQ